MAMTLELLASGYGLLEGPRVDDQNRLYFSDVPNGGVYRRSPGGKIETLIPERKGVGGIALNEGGGIVCSGRALIYCNEKTGPAAISSLNGKGVRSKGSTICNPTTTAVSIVGSLEFDALSD